jgi:peptide/nickel transport system substrate-binding protein
MNALALLLLLDAFGAPRTPYGGGMIAYVWGRSIATQPIHLATAADATIQRALYEPLYAIDPSGKLTPNLAAALPSIDGNRITIELRPSLVAHDGTPVTAARVAEWLTSLARRDSRASFVVLSIAGARERIAGADVPLRAGALDETTLLLELAHPHPDFARLLAGSHAGIGVSSGAGTGPFAMESAERGVVVLVPFLEHFAGRPFLDRVELRPLSSRFGTAAIARKEQAALVFETPDSSRIEPTQALRWPELAPREVLVLSIGEKLAGRRQALVDALEGAVNRRRLAGRYLDGNAEPAFTFVGKREPPQVPAALAESVQATLLVAKEARAGHRFAERVQLDLHRAGVIAVIERRSADELEKLRMSGDYELMLDVTLPGAPLTARAIDRLHALLSIGASYGRPDFVSPDRLARFFLAREEQKAALLEQIEAELKRSVGLVPLASRTPAISSGTDLMNVAIAPDGSIDLADVFLREEP